MGLISWLLGGGNIGLIAQSLAEHHKRFQDFNTVLSVVYKADFASRSQSSGSYSKAQQAVQMIERGEIKNYRDLAILALLVDAAPKGQTFRDVAAEFSDDLTKYLAQNGLDARHISGDVLKRSSDPRNQTGDVQPDDEGPRIVNFEDDVPQSVTDAMASADSPSAGLAFLSQQAVRMLSAASGAKVTFGGFAPAGNMHGVYHGGRVFVNYLATHQVAVRLARMRRIPYARAFAECIVAVLVCESAHALEPGYKAFGAITPGSFQDQIRMRSYLPQREYDLLVDQFATFMADAARAKWIDEICQDALPGWMEGLRRARRAVANH